MAATLNEIQTVAQFYEEVVQANAMDSQTEQAQWLEGQQIADLKAFAARIGIPVAPNAGKSTTVSAIMAGLSSSAPSAAPQPTTPATEDPTVTESDGPVTEPDASDTPDESESDEDDEDSSGNDTSDEESGGDAGDSGDDTGDDESEAEGDQAGDTDTTGEITENGDPQIPAESDPSVTSDVENGVGPLAPLPVGVPVAPRIQRMSAAEIEEEVRGWPLVFLPTDHGLSRDELAQFLQHLNNAGERATPPRNWPVYNGSWLDAFRGSTPNNY